jgi:hypothetical protein
VATVIIGIPTMTKLTETFHVVQLEDGSVYYLVRKDVIRKYATLLGSRYKPAIGFYIGDDYLGNYWGHCAHEYGLPLIEFPNINEYRVRRVTEMPSYTAIALTRSFFEMILSTTVPTEEPEVPTVKVW